MAITLPSEGRLFKTWLLIIVVGGIAGALLGGITGAVVGGFFVATGRSVNTARVIIQVIGLLLGLGMSYAAFRYFIRRLFIQQSGQ